MKVTVCIVQTGEIADGHITLEASEIDPVIDKKILSIYFLIFFLLLYFEKINILYTWGEYRLFFKSIVIKERER